MIRRIVPSQVTFEGKVRFETFFGGGGRIHDLFSIFASLFEGEDVLDAVFLSPFFVRNCDLMGPTKCDEHFDGPFIHREVPDGQDLLTGR